MRINKYGSRDLHGDIAIFKIKKSKCVKSIFYEIFVLVLNNQFF